MFNLENHVVVVTGAGGHLGSAVARGAAAAGASLVLLDRSARQLAAADLPAGARVFARGDLDLLDRASVSEALGEAHRHVGRITGLVCTVGAFEAGELAFEEDWSAFEAMLAANLRSAVTAIQAVAPLLAEGSSIVTVGARSARKGMGRMAAYGAAKAALVNFTESLAEDLAAREIRANCVLPSIIDTPANRAAMPDAPFDRWVAAAAVADVILFLLAPASRAVSGAAIPVFGRS
jgi:NAD(P)-dependent dehydrogenase (short-subunit alcohol dehydrogenase family)